MATPDSPSSTRPARDEWGVYDPQQAGIAAVVARLDARDKIPATPAPAVINTENPQSVAPEMVRPTLKDAR